MKKSSMVHDAAITLGWLMLLVVGLGLIVLSFVSEIGRALAWIKWGFS